MGECKSRPRCFQKMPSFKALTSEAKVVSICQFVEKVKTKESKRREREKRSYHSYVHNMSENGQQSTADDGKM